jgi:hypothetical protein
MLSDEIAGVLIDLPTAKVRNAVMTDINVTCN